MQGYNLRALWYEVVFKMKVKSKTFKGIEYVRLSELPLEQQEMMAKSLNNDLFIKILVGEKIQHDCIQFKDYSIWYENIFMVPSAQDNDVIKQAIITKVSKLVVK